MTVIDWMMAYPYLSAIIIVVGLLVLATFSVEIKVGNPNKAIIAIGDNKKEKKVEERA